MLKKGMEKSVGQESAGLQQASDMYREDVRPEWSSRSSKGNCGQAGRAVRGMDPQLGDQTEARLMLNPGYPPSIVRTWARTSLPLSLSFSVCRMGP